MRRRALMSIPSSRSCWRCAGCRQHLQLAPIGKRWIQIHATPSSPSPALEQLDIDSQKPASQPGEIVQRISLIAQKTNSSSRCSVRSPRSSLLPPLCPALRFTKSSYSTRHTRRFDRKARQCRFKAIPTLTLHTNYWRDPVPLPIHHIDHSDHSLDLHQICAHLIRRCASRWQARLDNCSAKCTACLDRAIALC